MPADPPPIPSLGERVDATHVADSLAVLQVLGQEHAAAGRLRSGHYQCIPEQEAMQPVAIYRRNDVVRMNREHVQAAEELDAGGVLFLLARRACASPLRSIPVAPASRALQFRRANGG